MKNLGFGAKVLIGFLVVIVAMLAAIIGLEISKRDYDDFVEIGSYQEIEDQEEDTYFVYWYGDNCSHCTAIKDQVMDFAKHADYEFYTINSSNASGTPNLIHPDDPTIYMSGTPTLIVIQNGEVVDMAVGGDKVPVLINQIESGNYDVID